MRAGTRPNFLHSQSRVPARIETENGHSCPFAILTVFLNPFRQAFAPELLTSECAGNRIATNWQSTRVLLGWVSRFENQGKLDAIILTQRHQGTEQWDSCFSPWLAALVESFLAARCRCVEFPRMTENEICRGKGHR